MASVPEDLISGGDPAAFKVSVDYLTTTDHTNIKLPRAGVTVVVGGNNVGKTTFLEEIANLLHRRGELPKPNYIISQASLFKSGTPQDFASWLKDHTPWSDEHHGAVGFIANDGSIVNRSAVENNWLGSNNIPGSLLHIAPLLVHKGDAHQRIQWIQPTPQREDVEKAATHPLHKLQDDHLLLEEKRALHKRIFRESLTLDRLSGKVQLRIGETSVQAPTIDAVTGEYRSALIALPPLHTQGDGMKSLTGLLMPIITGQYPIMIVDEPEAFLHPPQANVLGRILGELAQKRNVQIILATHDRNFLVGLLESEAPISVVHLDRQGSRTLAHQLDSDKVRELWDDPVLRYTNVLDGLFHRVVVLTEGDRDCRFYRASLDGLDERASLSFSPSDVLFVPAGGKDGLPRMIAALQSVSVPLVIVPDLDVLNDEGKIKRLVECVNGDWDACLPDYRIATEPFRQARASVTCGEILELIRPVLSSDPKRRFDKDVDKLIKTAMRTERSPWQDLKDYGMRAFRGQASVAAAKLLEKLNSVGIVPVREGELERLAPYVESRKGAGWLEEALRSEAHLQDPAQSHIIEVVTAIRQQLKLP
ncbi:ATP-dependent nuclease [Streptosporangium sp. V21-05]|uniref:ATP-dependent nuclease n=1 Tax=Streptosporangium sp. V21-05 TaxID=3446115 RepID=UPI003F529494